MIEFTRRRMVVAAVLAATGCARSGGTGIARAAVHNPMDEPREASVEMTKTEGNPLDATVIVPAAGTATLREPVVKGETVTVSITTSDAEATTDWTVETPTLHARLGPDGIDFRRGRAGDTARVRRDDGRVDIVVETVGAERPVDAVIRVGPFERDWTVPPNAFVAFHDRVPADGSHEVEVTTSDGTSLTESVSLDGVTALRIDLSGESSIRRVTPAEE